VTRSGLTLKAQASDVAAGFAPLLAQATHLAQAFVVGPHGRRRAGQGEEFWQYRPAQAGDPARAIDWRRSGQSDGHFIREQEWETAQSVSLWCDRSASMSFTSNDKHPAKAERVSVLGLALSMLLLQGGERVALLEQDAHPSRGAAHVTRLAEALSQPMEIPVQPDLSLSAPRSRAVFLSDFMGPIEPIEQALQYAATRGITGVLYQILDPAEDTFPYQGRTIFEAMSGSKSHETLRAGDLKARYLSRLADRRDHLTRLARTAGWQFSSHSTEAPAQTALMWLYQALEGAR
jgi:uncharacterized protein (DUF58 family)